MGTPSIVKRDHGFISVGSVVSEGNPFTSELVADTGGVRFTFSFSEDIDVSVEVTRAYTTRFSEIYSTELGPGGTGPPLMFKAFSSCFVRPDHLAVNETASDDSVPSLRTLVIPGSRKRRRKGAQRVVTVAGHLGQRALRESTAEHVRRCAEEVRRLGKRVDHVPWSRAIGAAVKCGLVTLRVEGHLVGLSRVPFVFSGTIDMPLGQGMPHGYYPPLFTRAVLAMLPGPNQPWNTTVRFTAVSVGEVERLVAQGGVLAGVGHALLRSALLCFVGAWSDQPFILVPGQLERVLSIPCEAICAATAFAILKLVVSLPLQFTVSHGTVTGVERSAHALVSSGGIFSVCHTPSALTVGIQPPEKVAICRWPTTWWVARRIAVQFSTLAATFGRYVHD